MKISLIVIEVLYTNILLTTSDIENHNITFYLLILAANVIDLAVNMISEHVDKGWAPFKTCYFPVYRDVI